MAAGETAADIAALMEFEGVDGVLAGKPVRGLFDEPVTVDPAGAYGFAAAQPQLRLPSAGLPEFLADAVLELQLQGRLRRFTVRESLPDGTGLTLLKLGDAP